MFERRDVWVLSDENKWHPTIEWYARAVGALRGRDGTNFSDPTSWRYLAEVHGTDIAHGKWPKGATWDQCQHSSWFFLPWHRMYLHHFERIVRKAIVDLGGPKDWALPYWNYWNPKKAAVRKLPPAFLAAKMPSGEANPLFTTERAASVKKGVAIHADAVSADEAMAEGTFISNGSGGFGGPVTGFSHAGAGVGSLENVPHGSVHVSVGGTQNPPGWMSRFETAGRDPIFWLHHANIDRLWEAWLQGAGGRANPADAKWLKMKFTIGSGTAVTTLSVKDVLTTTKAPLQYKYSDLSFPAPPPSRVLATKADDALKARGEMPADIPPEMVGASKSHVPLTSSRSEVEISVAAPTGPLRAMAPGTRPRKVFLKIENVTGTSLAAGTYVVHVNLPRDADTAGAAHDDRRAGRISMFGVPESTQSDEKHSGSGLTFSFDITALAHELQQRRDWDPEHLRVSFTPVPGSDEGASGGDVRVGRVSLFYA
ncbi:MAG: tyrosinase family protein [Gemmatimonadota bacterium]|nr:tyrosinase family protein [Gemmatimonadota bacterium]